MARPTPILLVLTALLSGCTAEHYEREADRQVTALVKDRENKSLGYQPKVDVPVDRKEVVPTKQAYAKIPQSAIPRDGQTQAEELKVELHYGPLGPKRFDWGDTTLSDDGGANITFESLD